jgi:Ni,Fe-hydrogenase I small subunit
VAKRRQSSPSQECNAVIANGTCSDTGSLETARLYPTATVLPSGKVLAAGGSSNAGTIASAEPYDPPTGTCP